MSGVTDNYGLILPADGEGYNVDIINQNNISIDALLKILDKKAQGLMNLIRNTTASASVSDGIISNLASFPFKGGRKYQIVWEGAFDMNTAANFWEMSINTSAVIDPAAQLTGLTQLDVSTNTSAGTGVSTPFRTVAIYEPGADTTLQLKYRLMRVVGGGTARIIKAKITVNDLGANY